jgi:hypothetical protein
MMSKYRNKKVLVDGVAFDSKKEAKRYRELKLMEDAGMISRLERQVKFDLLPNQKDPDADHYLSVPGAGDGPAV